MHHKEASLLMSRVILGIAGETSSKTRITVFSQTPRNEHHKGIEPGPDLLGYSQLHYSPPFLEVVLAWIQSAPLKSYSR
jgi:hypothetical protein